MKYLAMMEDNAARGNSDQFGGGSIDPVCALAQVLVKRPQVTAGNHIHCAILVISVVERKPARNHSGGKALVMEIVLMPEDDAAVPRRFVQECGCEKPDVWT